jgi:hypothetical protein
MAGEGCQASTQPSAAAILANKCPVGLFIAVVGQGRVHFFSLLGIKRMADEADIVGVLRQAFTGFHGVTFNDFNHYAIRTQRSDGKTYENTTQNIPGDGRLNVLAAAAASACRLYFIKGPDACLDLLLGQATGHVFDEIDTTANIVKAALSKKPLSTLVNTFELVDWSKETKSFIPIEYNKSNLSCDILSTVEELASNGMVTFNKKLKELSPEEQTQVLFQAEEDLARLMALYLLGTSKENADTTIGDSGLYSSMGLLYRIGKIRSKKAYERISVDDYAHDFYHKYGTDEFNRTYAGIVPPPLRGDRTEHQRTRSRSREGR